VKKLGITLQVITDDPAAAAEIMEQLARTAVALALRDFGVEINVTQFETDEDDE